ncbi:MAG TPA: endonuclease/exonuclease/phosphatase family protein [Pirellulales bacterium]|nr:endonuclease/exonuclease/phosphatase family protein [Pirellulales bacterium]
MTGASGRRQPNPLLGDRGRAAGEPAPATETVRATSAQTTSSHIAARAADGSSRSLGTRLLQLCAWFSLAVAVAAWTMLRWGTDRWSWATVLAYMPRWLWAAPLTLLIPATLVRPRRFWLPTSLTSLWVAWPLMGLCLSWPASGQSGPPSSALASDGLTVRVLTCNVGLVGFDPLEMGMLVTETQPDLIAFEENVSAEELSAAVGPDWHVSAVPGIVVASRWPIVDSERLTWPTAYGARTVAHRVRCRVPAVLPHESETLAEETLNPRPGADLGEQELDFVAVHFYSPRKGLEAVKNHHPDATDQVDYNTELRSAESTKVRRWIDKLSGPLIVAGDLNMPPESNLFRRDWSRFTDAFVAAGCGYGYTYGYTTSGWFYGIRIDHILADAGWRVERCWVGRHVGSDHRPVVAELLRR